MSHALRAVFLDHASLDLGDLDMRPCAPPSTSCNCMPPANRRKSPRG